jgi:hypothetical protein
MLQDTIVQLIATTDLKTVRDYIIVRINNRAGELSILFYSLGDCQGDPERGRRVELSKSSRQTVTKSDAPRHPSDMDRHRTTVRTNVRTWSQAPARSIRALQYEHRGAPSRRRLSIDTTRAKRRISCLLWSAVATSRLLARWLHSVLRPRKAMSPVCMKSPKDILARTDLTKVNAIAMCDRRIDWPKLSQ